jgi:DNA integrity scanning protein DisA with diadenylate cyclase activity
MAIIALLAKLWPWILVFLVWYYINRALDKIDSEAAKRKASKFWKKLWWAWGWAIGVQSKLAVVRWLLIGIALYLLFRWFAVSISTPVGV